MLNMTDANTMQDQRLIAIVTGGASGIGKAIAETLAVENITVVISDINATQGAAVAESLNGLFVPGDLSKHADCQTLVDTTIKCYGTVDILINNAGYQHIAPIENFPPEHWQQMIQLMLIAPFLLTQQVWPFMKAKQRGRIINMGSIHSQVASLNKSAYVSAKHGLLGLTKATALEGGEWGITANSVCPAYVKTPLVENQITDQASTLGIAQEDVIRDVMLAPASIKRLIEPTEVAGLVAYLCSEKAGAVTGAAWNIDLGWTAQ